MAITTQLSDQLTNLDASPSVIENSHNLHGRLRVAFFSFTQSGTGDAGSSFEAVRLPPGKVRLLGSLCNIEAAVAGASAKMDVGWDAYLDLDGTAVVADPDGILDNEDVDTLAHKTLAGSTVAIGKITAGTKAFESRDGVSIRLTFPVALADAETVDGYLVYVQD